MPTANTRQFLLEEINIHRGIGPTINAANQVEIRKPRDHRCSDGSEVMYRANTRELAEYKQDKTVATNSAEMCCLPPAVLTNNTPVSKQLACSTETASVIGEGDN